MVNHIKFRIRFGLQSSAKGPLKICLEGKNLPGAWVKQFGWAFLQTLVKICGKALVKKIKVALQTLPIDDDMVSRVTDGKLRAGPVLTVEPRRRKFHKLITLTLPSPAQHEGAQALGDK